MALKFADFFNLLLCSQNAWYWYRGIPSSVFLFCSLINETSGRESGFCITITHRTTRRLLCSNSSPRKAFLSSPNHRTLRISLRVTFGCSLLWKWASRGRVLQPWRTSNRMRQPNSGWFQKKPSAGASNNGKMDGVSVCVRARVPLWRWLGKRCHMSYHYSAIPQFREVFDCPSCRKCANSHNILSSARGSNYGPCVVS